MNKPTLTPEQARVVETWGQGISVIAGAGSGKTFTLVRKVRALLERDPTARFAAVSFTEKSARDLREKLMDLSFELTGEGLRGHWVTTIHGLCAHVLKEFPREAGYDGTEIQLTAPESGELWARALESLWFDDLSAEVEAALDAALERSTRVQLVALLTRVRELSSLGFLERFRDENLKLLARHVIDQYTRRKKHEGVIDFQDLEDGALRALRHESVRAHYRRVFSLVLVDEFQDTNPVQSEILSGFCREEFTNLCVVGDPKQSIYRFRDADVSVFEEFCGRLPTRVVLDKNYRSRPGVLSFTNEVCAPLFAASELGYDPLIATKSPGEMPAVLPVPVRSAADLAAFLWAERARGADFSEMVLLLRKVRGRSEGWLKTLVEHGIPIAIESGGLLWTDPRAREVASLLRFWIFPQDEMHGLAALRAPWIAISDAQIDVWKAAGGSLWRGFIESESPVARLFRESVNARMRPGEILALLLDDDALAETLGTVLLSLWHQCEELSSRGHSSVEVVGELLQRMEQEARERGVPPPEALGQLRVLTVHGAKGLEFPRVILLDFEPVAERMSHAPLLFWDRKRGAYLVDRDEDGAKDRTNADVKEWTEWEREQRLAESKRIFYVALTRAMDQLILILPPGAEENAEPALTATGKPRKPKAAIDPMRVDCWRGWIDPVLPHHAELAALRPRSDVSESVAAISTADGPRDRQTHSARRAADAFRETKLPPFRVRRPRHSVSELLKLDQCERRYAWSVVLERSGAGVEDGSLSKAPEPRNELPAEVLDRLPDEIISDAAFEQAYDEEREWRETAIIRGVDDDFDPSLAFLGSLADQTSEPAPKTASPKMPVKSHPTLSAREAGTRVHRALEHRDRDAVRALAEELGDPDFPRDAILNFIDLEEVSDRRLTSWNELAFEVPIETENGGEACVGAADRVECDEAGIYTVLDYKVLRTPASDRALHARYGGQLRAYAWAVARLAGVTVDRMRAALIVFHGDRYRRVAIPVGDDRFPELVTRAARLIALGAAGAPVPDAPTTGSYCSRCDQLARCPAGASALAAATKI